LICSIARSLSANSILIIFLIQVSCTLSNILTALDDMLIALDNTEC